MADDNKLLGQFDLVGIPPSPRGTPQIEVTFDIDANGIVKVSASDKATGKEQQITIQSSGGLSETEIEKMVKDAQSHAESDKKRKKLIEAKNQAEAAIYQTEKSLEEHKDKVPEEDVNFIQNEIKSLKEAMENLKDGDKLNEKIASLNKASAKIGEAVYKKKGQTTGSQTTSEQTTNKEKEGETVDAEAEDTNKKEK